MSFSMLKNIVPLFYSSCQYNSDFFFFFFFYRKSFSESEKYATFSLSLCDVMAHMLTDSILNVFNVRLIETLMFQPHKGKANSKQCEKIDSRIELECLKLMCFLRYLTRQNQ